MAGGVRFAELLDEPGGHLGVAVDLRSPEALQLQVAAPLDPFGNRGRRFAVGTVGQFAVFNGRNFDMQIDTVKERPGYAGPVPMDHDRRAGTAVLGIAQVAAGAGVERRNQHEA